MGLQNSWNFSKIENSWFDLDEPKKVAMGIVFDERLNKNAEISASQAPNHEGYCMVTYEELTPENTFCLSCGHEFCLDAWFDHVVEGLRKGTAGINQHCMQSGCNLMITHTAFLKILEKSEEDLQTYWKWLTKSYSD